MNSVIEYAVDNGKIAAALAEANEAVDTRTIGERRLEFVELGGEHIFHDLLEAHLAERAARGFETDPPHWAGCIRRFAMLASDNGLRSATAAELRASIDGL